MAVVTRPGRLQARGREAWVHELEAPPGCRQGHIVLVNWQGHGSCIPSRCQDHVASMSSHVASAHFQKQAERRRVPRERPGRGDLGQLSALTQDRRGNHGDSNRDSNGDRVRDHGDDRLRLNWTSSMSDGRAAVPDPTAGTREARRISGIQRTS